MRSVATAIVSIFMIAVMLAGDADASSIERKRTYGLREQGTGHIQMRSMFAPVVRSLKSRRTHNTTVTVVLTVRDNSKIGQICNKGPRISDALLRAWYQQPMVVDYLYDRDARGKTNVNYRRTLAQRAEDARLIAAVNHALGIQEVIGILVIKGAVKMGGGAVTKLPFSSVNGCDELQQTDDKKKPK